MTNKIRKLNLLHLVLSLETGGLERLVTDLALAIDKNLYNVDVCCFNNTCGFCDILVENGINVTLIQRNQNHYDYFYSLKLRKFMLENKIDILHMHNGTFFHGVQAGLLAKTPAMVYTDHGRQLCEPKKAILIDRFSGCFADKIVAVSKELESYLITTIGMPKHKTTTIINGINTATFMPGKKPADLMNEFGINEAHMVVGTVGRLAEVKDHLTLIDAFKLARRTLPNIILMIVGDGPMRHELETRITNLGLTGVVKIVGSRRDISSILNIFDVFVLTSLSEGTSIALLEAMSSGVPPIVTDVGGNTSIVDDKRNGIVIKTKQVNQLAVTLIDILVDDDKRSKMSIAATSKIHAKYSINNTLKSYCDLYSQVLISKGIVTF